MAFIGTSYTYLHCYSALLCSTSVLSNEPKKIPKGVVLAMLNNMMFKQGVQISQPEIQNPQHRG